MGARLYAPSAGTFTQLDTYAGSAADPASMNRFLYAQGNPTSLIDPTGHEPVCSSGPACLSPAEYAELKADYQAKQQATTATTTGCHTRGCTPTSPTSPTAPTVVDDWYGGLSDSTKACMAAYPDKAGLCIQSQDYPTPTDDERLIAILLLTSPLVISLVAACVASVGCMAALAAAGEGSLMYEFGMSSAWLAGTGTTAAYLGGRAAASPAGQKALASADDFLAWFKGAGVLSRSWARAGGGAGEDAAAISSAVRGEMALDRSLISTTISPQKQARHLADTAVRGGYLDSIDDAQAVLDAFHDGSAQVLGISREGHIVVRVPSVNGTNVNTFAGFPSQPTNVFMIKGQSSVSIVPTTPYWTPPR
jgi:hypothetical protein